MKAQIKELGDIITGNTPSKQEQGFWDSADICFVKPDMIGECGIEQITDSKEYISEKSRRKARIVNSNAILVTCIGTIGKVGIVRKECAFNQQINAIVPNQRVAPKYLAYCLLYNRGRLAEIANAPIVPIINKTQFGEFVVDIEDNKAKQMEIVETLDLVSSVIESRKQEIRKLDELIKARFVEMFGDPSINPNGYPVRPISEIAEYWNGLTYTPENVADEGTIVLRSSNIQNMQLDFQDIIRVSCRISEKKFVKDNDILMCSRNGSAKLVGKVALIQNLAEPMSFGAFMMIIRSKYYPYLLTFFQLPAFRAQIATGATTTINQITSNMMNRVMLPVPDTRTIDNFAAFTKQIDKSIFAVQQALDKAQLLLDSLMQTYFG